MMTKTPEWNLEDEEAREYAKALAAVARHYNLNVSAQAYDLTMLASVAGSIYMRRLQYFAERRRAARSGEAPVPATGAAPRTNGAYGDVVMGTELPDELLSRLRTDMEPN